MGILRTFKPFFKYCLALFLITSFFFSDEVVLAAYCTAYEPGQYSSSLALDIKGNPHVAWEQCLVSPNVPFDDCNQNDVYYTRSPDEGESFLPADFEIDRLPCTQARVSLAVDACGNPAVAWCDTREGTKYVYFSRSYDGGQTFTPGVRIDTTEEPQNRPVLKFDRYGNPVIAWIKQYYQAPQMNPVGYIYVTKSINGGCSFLPSVCVYHGARPFWGWPSMVIDSKNNPLVVMHYYRMSHEHWVACFSRSDDHGASFNEPVLVEQSPYHHYVSGQDVVAVDSNDNPYVVLTEIRGSRPNIRVVASVDGGKSFKPGVAVDPSSECRQITPSLATDSGDNLYVVWADSRPDGKNIRFSTSGNRGASFRPSICVDETPTLQNRPSLAVDYEFGIVHVTWSDMRQGRCHVYHSKSLDGGASFVPSLPVYAFPVD